VSETPSEERSSERGGPKVRSAEGEATRAVVSERSELTYTRNKEEDDSNVRRPIFISNPATNCAQRSTFNVFYGFRY